MSFTWQKIAPEHFAAFQRLMEVNVRQDGGVYWTAVRPLFYRPLWPLEELDHDRLVVPPASRLGGAQFAVRPGTPANSLINHLAFEETGTYSLEQLPRKPRKQVRLAGASLLVRPLTDVGEFIRLAYPVYQSFHDRTMYEVGAKRRHPAYFKHWAESLYAIPGVVILGGYQGEVLRGVSLSFLLGATVNYASFFCDTQALKLYLPDLMLHAIRVAAARDPSITRISVGLFKGQRGLDDFKLLRGAKLIRQPACLVLNPLTRLLLQRALPQHYAQMLGQLTAEQLRQAGQGPAHPDQPAHPPLPA